MGSGRTKYESHPFPDHLTASETDCSAHRNQEYGGIGGELGGNTNRGNDSYGGSDSYGDNSGRRGDDSQRDSGKDSTMGKLMEKAGGMLKNEKIQERGAEKRDQAGRGDDY